MVGTPAGERTLIVESAAAVILARRLRHRQDDRPRDRVRHAEPATQILEGVAEAVERGDADAAAAAVHEHMKRVRDRLLAYLTTTNGADT